MVIAASKLTHVATHWPKTSRPGSVISGDRILGASPKGHLVCCTVSLTRFG
jgi:hypothetical protein